MSKTLQEILLNNYRIISNKYKKTLKIFITKTKNLKTEEEIEKAVEEEFLAISGDQLESKTAAELEGLINEIISKLTNIIDQLRLNTPKAQNSLSSFSKTSETSLKENDTKPLETEKEVPRKIDLPNQSENLELSEDMFGKYGNPTMIQVLKSLTLSIQQINDVYIEGEASSKAIGRILQAKDDEQAAANRIADLIRKLQKEGNSASQAIGEPESNMPDFKHSEEKFGGRTSDHFNTYSGPAVYFYEEESPTFTNEETPIKKHKIDGKYQKRKGSDNFRDKKEGKLIRFSDEKILSDQKQFIADLCNDKLDEIPKIKEFYSNPTLDETPLKGLSGKTGKASTSHIGGIKASDASSIETIQFSPEEHFKSALRSNKLGALQEAINSGNIGEILIFARSVSFVGLAKQIKLKAYHKGQEEQLNTIIASLMNIKIYSDEETQKQLDKIIKVLEPAIRTSEKSAPESPKCPDQTGNGEAEIEHSIPPLPVNPDQLRKVEAIIEGSTPPLPPILPASRTYQKGNGKAEHSIPPLPVKPDQIRKVEAIIEGSASPLPPILPASRTYQIENGEAKTSQAAPILSYKCLFVGGSFIEDITVKPLFTYWKNQLDSSKLENKSLFGYYQDAWSISSLIGKAAITVGTTLTSSMFYVPELSMANNIIMHKSIYQLAGKLFYQQDYDPKTILKDVAVGLGTFTIQAYVMPESIYESPILAGFLSGLVSDSIDFALTAIAESPILAGLTSSDSIN